MGSLGSFSWRLHLVVVALLAVTLSSTGQALGLVANGPFHNQAPTSLSAVPAVAGIAPTSGSNSGGTAVTITGSGFAPDAEVTFDGYLATAIVVVNSTKITAVTPPATTSFAGRVDVTVWHTDGDFAICVGCFTYVAPTVTGVFPTSGSYIGGTLITITGTGFLPGAQVTIDYTRFAAVVVLNSTTIKAVTSQGAPGVADVSVWNLPEQASGRQGGHCIRCFAYIGPTVSSVSPASGPTHGGTAVTIRGTSFLSGFFLSIGDKLFTALMVVDDTTITAITPPSDAGPADIYITNLGYYSYCVGCFTYVAAVAPTVTAIAPASGSTAGDTAAMITGTGFAPGAQVTFDGELATNVVVMSSTRISARTPPGGIAGPVNVVVYVGDQFGTCAGCFTYLDN